MDKLVYLFELDSVRNSIREIEIGQQALLDEIVKNGNRVVLTFNQLTDSVSFLSLINDSSTYQNILELFKSGALKISRYGYYKELETKTGKEKEWVETRTASKYVQASIEKCIKDNKDSFLFSAWPVKSSEKELLQMMLDALKYSDPSLLSELRETLAIKLKNTAADRRSIHEGDVNHLDSIIRFISMMLAVSIEDLASNSPITDESNRSFIMFMQDIYSLLSNIKMHDGAGEHERQIIELLPQTIQMLRIVEEEIRTEALQTNNAKLINERSKWHMKFHERKQQGNDENVLRLAEAIVDVCYNFTVEESILGISKHYSKKDTVSFKQDFVRRLIDYWKDYDDGTHDFLKGDINTMPDYSNCLQGWDTAARVTNKGVRRTAKKAKPVHNVPGADAPLYEADYKKEKRRWYKKLTARMLYKLFIAFVYIIVFIAAQQIFNILQNVFAANILKNEILAGIIGITIFGILSSLLFKITAWPDILESIRNIGNGIKDSFRIFVKPIFKPTKKRRDSK